MMYSGGVQGPGNRALDLRRALVGSEFILDLRPCCLLRAMVYTLSTVS
jgi:hypothetical protein